MSKKIIAFLGPNGSFSHQAAINKFKSNSTLVALDNFEEIFYNVENNHAEKGIVPVENSLEGIVGNVYDLLVSHDLHVSEELYEKIEHFLVSKSGNIDEINKVASHPQALGQCRKWLENNLREVELISTSSTAAAAKLASNHKEIAAICSKNAAEVYLLNPIKEKIEDAQQNTTRFFILEKNTTMETGRDKTTIALVVENKQNALFNVFQMFKNFDLNITNVQTRPRKNIPWEYVFYFDFIGHIQQKHIQNFLKDIKKISTFLKVLGSYPNEQKGI